MHKIALVATLVALLVPCFAFAQDAPEGPMQPAWRLRAGWFDMGDADNGLGVGIDYMFPAAGQHWMAGIEWGDGEVEYYSEVDSAENGYGSSNLDVWGGQLTWVKCFMAPKTPWYAGLGVGWYRVDNSESDDSFGAHVLAGVGFAENWFAELKYVFATDFEGDADIDGIRASIGYKFGGK